MGRTEGVMNISACAEEGDEVDGRTSRVQESDLDSDALQDFLWDCEKRRRRGGHG